MLQLFHVRVQFVLAKENTRFIFIAFFSLILPNVMINIVISISSNNIIITIGLDFLKQSHPPNLGLIALHCAPGAF